MSSYVISVVPSSDPEGEVSWWKVEALLGCIIDGYFNGDVLLMNIS